MYTSSIYVSQVEEFGVSVEPYALIMEYTVLHAGSVISRILAEAIRAPNVYPLSVEASTTILNGGWRVVVEKPNTNSSGFRILLARPAEAIPDVDAIVGPGYREVTRDSAEYLHDTGHNLVVQLRHYWKCPSGTSGCDVGYCSVVDGVVTTTPTWRNYGSDIRAVFGHTGSDIYRYFIEY